jgi:pimeloyl-ACP methyl ester carboxylesterase
MLNYGGLSKEREYIRSAAILVDIGFGQHLYMNCTGSGAPTVILDAPTGSSSDMWLEVAAELAALSTVCVYDRAGLGLSEVARQLNGSDPGEGAVLRTLGPESTVVRMVSDLHRLVTISSKQDVGGLVVIDPLHSTLLDTSTRGGESARGEESDESPWIHYWFYHLITSYRLLQISAMMGLNRLGLLAGHLNLPDISADENVIARQKHQICDPFHIQAVIDEYRNIGASIRQGDEISRKWALPLNISTTVISGSILDSGLDPEMSSLWGKSIKEFVSSVPGSRHIELKSTDSTSIYRSQEVRDELKKTLINLKKKIKEKL